MTQVGTVKSAHRYPVKSMVGENLAEIELTASGVFGDRVWAARNLELGEQQGARKLPRLLLLRAWFREGSVVGKDAPLVGFPDGTELPADSREASTRVSELVGAQVELVPLPLSDDRSHFENASRTLDAPKLRKELGVLPGEPAPDLSTLGFRKLVELSRYATPPGTYVDVYPVHVLTTSSLRYVAGRSANPNVDSRRYRPNVVIDTGTAPALLEPDWESASLDVGECRIRIETRTIRCSVPGRAQAIEGLEADKAVVRAVAEHADRHLGAYATVERPGTVRVGDVVRLVRRSKRPVADTVRKVQQSVVRAAVRVLLRDPR